MIPVAHVAWRTTRIELVLVLVVGIGIGLAAAIDALGLSAFKLDSPACLALLAGRDGWSCPGLEALGRATSDDILVGPLIIVPWLAGGLLGSQIVAREIDRGSIVLPWSLSGDRVRWLVSRATLPLVVLVVSMIVASVGESLLVAARRPWLDPWASLADFGTWGLTPVLAGVAGFAVATAIGAVTGRQVLSLVVSLVMCTILALAIRQAAPYGVPSDAWIHWEVAERTGAGFVDPEPDVLPATWETGQLPFVPGDRLLEVLARQSAILSTVTVLGVGAAAVAVRRRRPSP